MKGNKRELRDVEDLSSSRAPTLNISIGVMCELWSERHFSSEEFKVAFRENEKVWAFPGRE